MCSTEKSRRWVLVATVFCVLSEAVAAGVRVNLANCECGVSNEGVAMRIVGGEESQPHIYPWISAIYNRNSLHCGGALINNRYILTAGHCVKWVNGADLTVYLGMHDRYADGVLMEIERIILHPDFTSDYLHDTNDIALLKLRRNVHYTDEISPVCLPHPLSDYTGRKAVVAGWGRLGSKEEPSQILRQAEVKVMRLDSCKNTSIGSHLADTMLCAYAYDTDACQGDSGGPLLYERRPSNRIEQIGVVSWGIGCATPGIPGVYTKVTDYLDWIAENTRDATYCAINN